MLPAGGARNALDTALWDLEAKRTGIPVWERWRGIAQPVDLDASRSAFAQLEAYEQRARELARYRG